MLYNIKYLEYDFAAPSSKKSSVQVICDLHVIGVNIPFDNKTHFFMVLQPAQHVNVRSLSFVLVILGKLMVSTARPFFAKTGPCPLGEILSLFYCFPSFPKKP